VAGKASADRHRIEEINDGDAMGGMWHSRGRRAASGQALAAAIFCLAFPSLISPSLLSARGEPTIEELKAKVGGASAADRPALCIQIAERQLSTADKFYLAGESEKGHAALADVTAYAAMARDSAIQSHKHEKQAEIAIRKMTRKLSDMKHLLVREDQDPAQKTIEQLERIRDDLLAAMFDKGDKR
jgi:hypothetical protein